jgi:proteic killer suppression protein
LRGFGIISLMKIGNVIHKGLRRFVEADIRAGLPAASVDKIRKIVSFLQDMDSVDELRAVPIWKAHLMTGDKKGTWSLCVTGNWRITFQIDREGTGIINLDYTDYH